MRNARDGQAWLEPLEAMWGLACPLIGAPQALAGDFAGALAPSPAARGAPLLLCGLVFSSARFSATARALAPRYRLQVAPPTRRHIASLEGGLDGFLARRSRNFRRSLGRAERLAAAEGIEIASVEVSDPDQAYQRLLRVEERSWKGRDGVGFAAGEMLEFYRHMIPRLHRRGALRLMFARRDGEDLAYIFGGVLGDTYRGLQFSFDADHAHLSLGNLCQLRQVEALCAEGLHFYDLGAEVEYKQRWGERVMETVTLVAQPR